MRHDLNVKGLVHSGSEFEQSDIASAGQIDDSEPGRKLIAELGQGHALEAAARAGPGKPDQSIASSEGQAARITGQLGDWLRATRTGINRYETASAGVEQPDLSLVDPAANEARQSPARPSCSPPRR